MLKVKSIILILIVNVMMLNQVLSREEVPQIPRIIISTDIGGTDPDDNQSMIHFLMYNDLFDIEGLISSPSYGDGSKEEILRMIDLYEQDYPKLKKCYPNLKTPDALKSITKQGHKGLAPYKGFTEPSEGSRWIINQARKKSDRPLWILVWGTVEDLAQALHDAPDIVFNIRVYYIGGPNKKWGINSYAYIVYNFPNLWIIENDATYTGFIFNQKLDLDINYGKNYYDYAIKGGGKMGEDFINYYEGIIKMGDTPSLLYMMDGDPNEPSRESWGGSFTHMKYSSRRIFNLNKSQNYENLTAPVYSIIEFHFPCQLNEVNINKDQACFNMTIDNQIWEGFYIGDGDCSVRYSPKYSGSYTYKTISKYNELNGLEGKFEISNDWPGEYNKEDYLVGDNWFTDVKNPKLFEDKWQGAGTVRKWRKEILEDWAERWKCLRKE